MCACTCTHIMHIEMAAKSTLVEEVHVHVRMYMYTHHAHRDGGKVHTGRGGAWHTCVTGWLTGWLAGWLAG